MKYLPCLPLSLTQRKSTYLGFPMLTFASFTFSASRLLKFLSTGRIGGRRRKSLADDRAGSISSP